MFINFASFFLTTLQNNNPNPREAKIFWWSLYLFPAMWALLAMTAFLKLSLTYLVCLQHMPIFSPPQLIVLIALCLNVANVVGYWKCSKEAKQKFASVAGAVSQSILKQAVTSMASTAFGMATAPTTTV